MKPILVLLILAANSAGFLTAAPIEDSSPMSVGISIEVSHEKLSSHNAWDGHRGISAIISHLIVPFESAPDVYAIWVNADGEKGVVKLCRDSYLCRMDLHVPSGGLGLLFLDHDLDADDVIDGLIILRSDEQLRDGTAVSLNKALHRLVREVIAGDTVIPMVTSSQQSLVPEYYRAVVATGASEHQLQQSLVTVQPMSLDHKPSASEPYGGYRR